MCKIWPYIFIPPLPGGGGGILFYLSPSICPSVRPRYFSSHFFSATIDGRNLIFRHKLHIGTPFCGKVFWPVRFLLPVCWLSWLLYTFNIYAHFSSHFSQQLLMTGIWYMVTSFISVPHMVVSVFGPIRFLLPVCRLGWFLYTLNIYAGVS